MQNKIQRLKKRTIIRQAWGKRLRIPITQSFPTPPSNLCLYLLYNFRLDMKNLKLSDTVLTCFTSCPKLSYQETYAVCVAIWCSFPHKHEGKRAIMSPDTRYHKSWPKTVQTFHQLWKFAMEWSFCYRTTFQSLNIQPTVTKITLKAGTD